MEAIKIEVTGNIAKVIEKPLRITAGTVGLPVEFVFDSHWDNMTKVAVFNTGIVKKNMKIVGSATVVPIEALAVPELNLSIGVYGVSEDGAVATPTVWASVGQIRHGAVPGSSFGSDIGTAKKYYDLGEQAAEKADASAKKAESEADRAEAAVNSANEIVGNFDEQAQITLRNIQGFTNNAYEAARDANNAADRAEEAADRAESAGGGVGGGTVIVALDEGNAATHTALEIYDAIQNEQTVVFHHTGRLIDEFVPLKISKPDLAVFSKAGYPTEFDIFDIEINNSGTISYNTHFSSALVNQAVEKVETDLAPVSYLPQALTEEQKAQAKENIGASTYYHTTREKIDKLHSEPGWTEYIYNLYRKLPGVIEHETKSNDGTFVNYTYEISTGEYVSEGYASSTGKPEPDIKKPKFLILTGFHGIERHAILSAYRFVRDVVYGHNIPTFLKEGAIIHVMPVASPQDVENFSDANTPYLNNESLGTSQAIANWLKQHADADLFIDLHNGNRLNEVAVIIGNSSYEDVKSAKKIAMRGIDKIVPFWREVIGYRETVEIASELSKINGIYYVTKKEQKPVIYSYCVDVDASNRGAFGYAQNILQIPSLAIEYHDFYGDYSDYNSVDYTPQPASSFPNNTDGTIEAIAGGAETIGNILLEFYKQFFMSEVVDDMKAMDSKLDSLLAQVNSGFHSVSGTFTLTEATGDGSKATFACTVPGVPAGAKVFIFEADEETLSKIKAKTTGYYSTGGRFCFVDGTTYGTRPGLTNAQVNGILAYSSTDATNTDGLTMEAFTLIAGKYNWTAYYWND
jgi:hypothetical protein